MGGFVPVDAAPACGHADRAALVAAERHVGLADGDQHAAAGRRAARGVALLVRVLDHAGGGGGAAAIEAEVGVGGLADDGAASIENPGHHGRVDIGHIALEHRSPVHHRHAGQADIVLENDPLALERPAAPALHLGLPVPGVVGVLLRRRPVARAARILHRKLRLVEIVEPVIGRDRALHEAAIRFRVLNRDRHAVAFGDIQDLFDRRCAHRRKLGHPFSSRLLPRRRRAPPSLPERHIYRTRVRPNRAAAPACGG